MAAQSRSKRPDTLARGRGGWNYTSESVLEWRALLPTGGGVHCGLCTRSARFVILSALILVASVLVQSSSTPAAAAVDPVDSFNARALGSPGVRRVRLELQSSGRTTRSFEIVHAWRESNGAIGSLVLLDAPNNFRGTSYLWTEDDALPTGVSVFLRMPLGKRRVLGIEPGRFDEGVLGSDFSYSDLLWRIRRKGRRLRVTGEKTLGQSAAQIVESRADASTPQQTMAWERIDYYVSRDSHWLLGADYYERAPGGNVAATPAKSLRVMDWTVRDGVGAPSTMIMSRPDGRRSVLT